VAFGCSSEHVNKRDKIVLRIHTSSGGPRVVLEGAKHPKTDFNTHLVNFLRNSYEIDIFCKSIFVK
jgi:hypothetical protein